MSTSDSPRWCEHCQSWGDHHTDRCWRQVPLAKDRPELVPAAEWSDPGKPEPGADRWDVILYGIVAIACVALAIWLCTRDVDPCPDGWHERTLPSATVCTNPRPAPSVHSRAQPRK